MKTLQIRLTDEEHKLLKVAAAKAGMTLKQYLLELVKASQA